MTCILVVDDDPWIQWMIADDLADRGYEVVTARDGVEALESIAQAHPDVIVLDLMLPRLNGWEFADQYQTASAGNVIPIIAVSAARYPAALSAGSGRFQRYLAKPFDIEELAGAVAELAGQQHSLAPV